MVTIQVQSSCVVQGEVLGFKSLKESFISIYTQIKIQQNLYLTYIYIYIIVTQTTFFKKRNEWPPRISLTNGKSLVIELFWSSLSLTQYVMSEKTIFFFFSFSYMNLKKNILGQSYKSSTIKLEIIAIQQFGFIFIFIYIYIFFFWMRRHQFGVKVYSFCLLS